MMDKRTYTNHLGIERLHKQQVVRDVLSRLKRRSDHNSTADLIADFLKIVQTVHTVFERLLGRMKLFIVLRVRGLVAEQVSVRAEVEEPLIAFAAFFAERERKSAVGVARLYFADDFSHTLVGEIRIFAALKHKGAEAEAVALVAAFDYIIEAEPVALAQAVASSYPAVEAVAAAVV